MTDTDRTDLRTKMLADATAHRDAIYAERDTAYADRNEYRDNLRKITAELQDRINDTAATIAELTREAAAADALVRSLTPRKPRSDRHPQPLMEVLAPDTDQ